MQYTRPSSVPSVLNGNTTKLEGVDAHSCGDLFPSFLHPFEAEKLVRRPHIARV